MAGSRVPERIDRIVELLRRYWTEHPDLRLGQIVGNAADAMSRDPYYIEDEEVETDLRLQLSRLQPEAQPTGAPSRLNAESMPSVPDLPPRDETGRWTNQPAGAPEPPPRTCPANWLGAPGCVCFRDDLHAGEHP